MPVAEGKLDRDAGQMFLYYSDISFSTNQIYLNICRIIVIISAKKKNLNLCKKKVLRPLLKFYKYFQKIYMFCRTISAKHIVEFTFQIMF